VVIRGQRIYRHRLNFSETDESYKYTDGFHLTSLKMEERLGMVGFFLHQETNQSRAPSEKQLLQIALHWLDTRVQYSVGYMHCVSKASVCMPVFISDRC
jgi:hypothetical protein